MTLERLQGQHFSEKVIKGRDCRICSKRSINEERHLTNIVCSTCSDHPPLCIRVVLNIIILKSPFNACHVTTVVSVHYTYIFFTICTYQVTHIYIRQKLSFSLISAMPLYSVNSPIIATPEVLPIIANPH